MLGRKGNHHHEFSGKVRGPCPRRVRRRCRLEGRLRHPHSYGGAVTSEAGTHEKVAALVYIAAFAADGPQPPILPPRDGFLLLDRAKFPASFAGDVDAETAAFMADSQTPWGVEALGGSITEAAWRAKPSWYLVATDDRMIPPPAQRFMATRAGATVVEAAGSHSIYVSQPGAVAALIARAANSL